MTKQNSKYTYKGHGSAITRVTFSEDGKRLVSESVSNRTIVWDVETASVSSVYSITENDFDDRWRNCLSPDASRIATATEIWDAATGQVVRKHDYGDAFAYSPDGKLLVVSVVEDIPRSYDKRLKEILLIDSQTGLPTAKVWTDDGSQPALRGVNSFAFSPDGAFLAFINHAVSYSAMSRHSLYRTYSLAQTIYVYELKTGVLTSKSAGVEYCRLFWTSANGKTTLVATSFNGSKIWDGETGELLYDLPKPDSESHWAATLSPDGNYLARTTGHRHEVLEVYRVEDGALLWRHKRQTSHGCLRTVAFTSDSRRVATAGDDLAIFIHDTETGERVQTLGGAMPKVTALAYTPDGAHISALYDDGSARLWNVETRTLEKWEVMPPERRELLGCLRTSQIARNYWNLPFNELPAFNTDDPSLDIRGVSPDGTLVALMFPRYHVYTCAEEEEDEDVITDVEDPASLSPQDRALYDILLPKAPDEFIVIWSVATKSILWVIPTYEAWDCVFFPDNRRFAISDGVKVAIYSTETGELVQRLEVGNTYKVDLTLSPNGNILAAKCGAWEVIIWDVRTGERFDTPHIRADDGISIAFSPDGDRFITSLPHWGYPTLRRFSNSDEALRLKGHLGHIRATDFSPDGKFVATGAHDGAIKLWDATSGALWATFQALPDEGAWVVHTAEGEITGSPGAEAYLTEM